MIQSKSACLVVIALVLCSLCWSVSAHSAAEMGVAPDQYDKGIPVYWPVHAGLMLTGFILLLTGFMVMRYHKTPRGYRSHMILQSAGGTLAIGGLVTSFAMVSISGVPHFRYSHDLLGIGTILVLIGLLLLGYAITRKFSGKLRPSCNPPLAGAARHRFCCRKYHHRHFDDAMIPAR